MPSFIISRLVQALATAIGVSLIGFLLVRLSGDPVTLLVPDDATPAVRQQIERELGLDRPEVIQYVVFLKNAAHGNFGRSIRYNRGAGGLIGERLTNSAKLGALALVISVLLGVSAGVCAAVFPDSLADLLARIGALLGQSIPNFWLAVMLILFFAVKLRWLPTSGMGGWKSYIMPAVTLSGFATAALMRLTRSAMLDFLHSESVTLLRAKGLATWRIVWIHGLRNAGVVLIGAFAIQFVAFLGGSFIIESIFAWPGVGRLAVDSIYQRDYPVVQMIVVLLGVFFVLANMLADLAYGLLDPRIRS